MRERAWRESPLSGQATLLTQTDCTQYRPAVEQKLHPARKRREPSLTGNSVGGGPTGTAMIRPCRRKVRSRLVVGLEVTNPDVPEPDRVAVILEGYGTFRSVRCVLAHRPIRHGADHRRVIVHQDAVVQHRD